MYGNYLTGKRDTSTKTPSRARNSSKGGSSTIQVQGYMEEAKNEIGDALRKASDIMARYGMDLMESGESDTNKIVKSTMTVLDGFSNEEKIVILSTALAKIIANS